MSCLVRNTAVLIWDVLCLLVLLLIPAHSFAAACILLADGTILLFFLLQPKTYAFSPAYLLLNLTYFLFLLSGATLSLFCGTPVEDYLRQGADVTDRACLMAFLGIAALNNTYLFCVPAEIQLQTTRILPKTTDKPSDLQRAAVFLLFLSAAICKLVMTAEVFWIARTHGYHTLFTRTRSVLPTWIHHVGSLFYGALTLFLACRFRPAWSRISYGIVFLLAVLLLVAGDRTEAVCGLLILVCDDFFRRKKRSRCLTRHRWFLIPAFLALPGILYLLQTVSYTRSGLPIPPHAFDQVLDFFRSQGISLNVLANAISSKQALSEWVQRPFLWGQLESYLTQNALSRKLFGIPRLAQNTVEMARSGYCYSSALSYLLMRDSYLLGIGCGTSYLAELYHDFSWFGVIAGSALVGLLLKHLNRWARGNWILYGLYLNCVRSLLMLPRGSALRWFTETFSVPNLLLLILILLLGVLSPNPARHTEGAIS